MKTLITGCAGFIGRRLARHFLKAGADLVGVDRLSRSGAEENLQCLAGQDGSEFSKEDIRAYDADPVAFGHYTLQGFADALRRRFASAEVRASHPETRSLMICEK